MKICVIIWLLFLTTGMLTSGLKIDFSKSFLIPLQGQLDVSNFLLTEMPQIRAIYFYKTDVKFLKSFIRELNKATKYLELYGVKAGFCNCTEKINTDVKECAQEKVETSVHIYKQGVPLLSLELKTMFDVNSIMSNILHCLMLNEVPVLYRERDLRWELLRVRGTMDAIVARIPAVGTLDHRIFMEVAYAYLDKLKFVVCTDKMATAILEQLPEDFDGSSVWWVWTKNMSVQDSHFHNIRYRGGDLSLKALARFVMATTLPKMFDIPANGTHHPYDAIDLPVVQFFYDDKCMDDVYQKAHKVTRSYGGKVVVLLVNLDRVETRNYNVPGQKPAVSIVHKKGQAPHYLQEEFTSDNLAVFLESQLAEPMYPAEPIMEIGVDVNMKHEEMDANLQRRPPDMDIKAVEHEDDKVANAVEKTRRVPMQLDLVPALTDKTFPSTLRDAPTVIILFYFPVDAVSMGYLRMFGEAVDMLGKRTTLHIARVNCFDWTDVCSYNNITDYPTLRFYSNGKMAWDYQGPQDTQVFYSTLKLLEMSLPLYLTVREEVIKYIQPQQDLSTVTNITVMGFFTKDNFKEMNIFQEFAMNMSIKKRFLSVYTDIKDVVDVASILEMKVPSVIMMKFDDDIEPMVRFGQDFSVQNLDNFVELNLLPKLGVLTPLMYPNIRRRYSDLTILFTNGSAHCLEYEHILRQIVKENHFHNVSFKIMTVSSNSSVGYKVLKQYTSKPTVPHISLVRLQKGEVHNYMQGKLSLSALNKWLTFVMEGEMQPSTLLIDTKWQPLNKGYEFLRIIDWTREHEKKMSSMKHESDSQLEEFYDEMKLKHDAVEDSDAIDTRKDLIDLKKSRLYHHAPGRSTDHTLPEPSGIGGGLQMKYDIDGQHKHLIKKPLEMDQTPKEITSSKSPTIHDPSEL